MEIDEEAYCYFPRDVGGMLDSINSVTGFGLSLVGGEGRIIGELESEPPVPEVMPAGGIVELWNGILFAGVTFNSWDEALVFVRGVFYGVFRSMGQEDFVAFFKSLDARGSENATFREREQALFDWLQR